jgi:AhpD family alkylhydroperoxidase
MVNVGAIFPSQQISCTHKSFMVNIGSQKKENLMRHFKKILALLTLVAAPAFAAHTVPKSTKNRSVNPEVQAVYKDMQESLGLVPDFFKAFPEYAIVGAWDEIKSVHMNQNSAIPSKYKELIGLGVAAQIPCSYCVYFHTQFAKLNGATDDEIKHAIVEASVTRHWSTFLNGSNIEEDVFNSDIKKLVDATKKKIAQPQANEVNHFESFATSEDALKDIEKTYGFVPTFMNKFPSEGLAGAWAEMKSVEMNPNAPIPSKYVSLTGLAVASQIPCKFCVSAAHQFLTQIDGATQKELSEAVTIAAGVRHWSTFINGIAYPEAKFKKEIDQIITFSKKRMKTGATASN